MSDEGHKDSAFIEFSLKEAQGLAGNATYAIRTVSETIEKTHEHRIDMTLAELLDYEKAQLPQIRIERMKAATIALAASRNMRSSAVNPQMYTAEKPGIELNHPALVRLYQLGELIEAFAREQISVEDFGTACRVEGEKQDTYLQTLSRWRTQPDEVADKEFWMSETAATITELQTYQTIAALVLTKAK